MANFEDNPTVFRRNSKGECQENEKRKETEHHNF